MKPPSHLSLAQNVGLTRINCSHCKSETLHKFGQCVHCGSEHLFKRRKNSKPSGSIPSGRKA